MDNFQSKDDKSNAYLLFVFYLKCKRRYNYYCKFFVGIESHEFHNSAQKTSIFVKTIFKGRSGYIRKNKPQF